MDAHDLTHRFTYHPPVSSERAATHERIRRMGLAMAIELDDLIPDGREKALAMTHLEETVMWANAALARAVPEEDAAG